MTDTRAPEALALSVSGGYAQLLPDWFASQSLPLPTALKRIQTLDPARRVPLVQWANWVTLAALAVPGKKIELQIGAIIDYRHAGMLGHLVRLMPTLADALSAYSRFEALQYGRPWSRFAVDADSPRLIWPDAGGMTHLGVETIALASFYSFVCKRMQLGDVVSRVSFGAPEPTISSPWRDFFSCEVKFGQRETSLEFHPRSLSMSLAHVGAPERQRLLLAAESAASLIGDASPFVVSALQILQETLPDGGAKAPLLANRLGVSTRTLHKRLAAAGWSFQRLLDSTRQQHALFFLDDRALALSEISFLLGFSEQSVFTRAFRQWTGTTPGEWRRPGC